MFDASTTPTRAPVNDDAARPIVRDGSFVASLGSTPETHRPIPLPPVRVVRFVHFGTGMVGRDRGRDGGGGRGHRPRPAPQSLVVPGYATSTSASPLVRTVSLPVIVAHSPALTTTSAIDPSPLIGTIHAVVPAGSETW